MRENWGDKLVEGKIRDVDRTLTPELVMGKILVMVCATQSDSFEPHFPLGGILPVTYRSLGSSWRGPCRFKFQFH